MRVLLDGAALLLLSFVVQLAFWRLALPKSQTRALLAIFVAVPPVAAGIAWALQHPFGLTLPEIVRLALLYISCMLAYIVLYSAIEMQSPTLAIVSYLASRGQAGGTDEDLFARFGQDDTMRSRVLAIEQSGWVTRAGDTLTLTPAGIFYARIFERGSTIVGLALTKGG